MKNDNNKKRRAGLCCNNSSSNKNKAISISSNIDEDSLSFDSKPTNVATFVDLEASVIGGLTVLGYAGKSSWWCRCECGKIKKFLRTNLCKIGHSTSCGCRRRTLLIQRKTIHGCSGKKPTREYRAWSAARNRCRNINDPDYKEWGGRGVKFCERWEDFRLFLSDMGPAPPRTSLGRKENNGGYEPTNCEWQTWVKQNRNRRNSILLTLYGVTKHLREWAEEWKLNATSLAARLKAGWTVEEAIVTPTRHYLPK